MENNAQSGNSYYLEDKAPSGIGFIISKIGQWFMNSIQAIVILLTFLVIMYLFVFTPHIVDGQSMQPNFCDKDIYFTNKLVSYFREYKIGEVVTFKYDEANSYVKRVVGVGGDRMRIEGGRVYRNGEPITEIYLPEGRKTDLTLGMQLKEGEEYVVPQGRYFVLGDNRPNSKDSRAFLAIDPKEHDIDGKVVLVLWPLNRFRIFDEDKAYLANTCDL